MSRLLLCFEAMVVVVALWSACGMRSDLLSPEEDDAGDQAGIPGNGGNGGGGISGGGGHIATGGSDGTHTGGTAGHSIGGNTSTGGNTAPNRGGSGGSGGTGGSRTGGAGGFGGGAIIRTGGSAIIRTGGSAIINTAGSGGSGGIRTGGSGGSGGSGGKPGTGGTSVASPDAAPRSDARTLPVGVPKVDPNTGYTTIVTGDLVLSGYVTGTTQGSGSSISLTYNENSFCAQGVVGASSTYNSWAVASFNVNQPESTPSQGPVVINGSEVDVTYSNGGGSKLEFQLWDNLANQYWCNYLPTSTSARTMAIKFSDLNTQCWNNSGTVFVSGTAITAVQLSVPGDASSKTPFDFCFLGLTIK